MSLRRVSQLVTKIGRLSDPVTGPSPIQQTSRRHFFNLFKYFDRALNIYDQERLDLVGSDRLCAEWVLKCGGRLRWEDSTNWLSDYNSLPPENTEAELVVQDIDVSETVVMSIGFKHIWDLKGLKSLKLHGCKYIDDAGIEQLQHTTLSLEQLQISANNNITDKSLLTLAALVDLKDLHLKDLPKVQNKRGVYQKLQTALPDCDIIYPDIENSPV